MTAWRRALLPCLATGPRRYRAPLAFPHTPARQRRPAVDLAAVQAWRTDRAQDVESARLRTPRAQKRARRHFRKALTC